MVVNPPWFTCRMHLLHTVTHNILVKGIIEVVAKGKSRARVTMCTYFTVGHMQSALQLFRHALRCCSYQKGCDVAGFQEVTTDASSLCLHAQFVGCQVSGSRMGARQAWLISHLQLLMVCLALRVFSQRCAELLCCHSSRQDGCSKVHKSSRGVRSWLMMAPVWRLLLWND